MQRNGAWPFIEATCSGVQKRDAGGGQVAAWRVARSLDALVARQRRNGSESRQHERVGTLALPIDTPGEGKKFLPFQQGAAAGQKFASLQFKLSRSPRVRAG